MLKPGRDAENAVRGRGDDRARRARARRAGADRSLIAGDSAAGMFTSRLDATFKLYPDTGHVVSAAMLADVEAMFRAALTSPAP